jgi:hypothetical protein
VELNNYLRLSILLGDSQARTFNTNLCKMVSLVLLDNNNNKLNLVEIVDRLHSKYNLEFDSLEVLNAIKRNNTNFVQFSNSDPQYNTFTLTPKEYDKLQKAEQNNIILEMTQKFLLNNPEFEINVEELSTLLIKFFYFIFNSNTQMILSLMKKETILIEHIDVQEEFSNNDRFMINRFLSWDNKDKNYYVFKIISCCFDYCMMTVKKDNSSFNNLFNNKVFYLDANIIFRLSGFNKVERKKVMFAFVNKCKEVGITLKYTNVTLDEIYNTISHIVDGISKTLENHNPLSTQAMMVMSSKYNNLDFYDQYVEWVKKPNNKVGDYESFKDYLNKMIRSVVKEFEFVSFESFEKKLPENIFQGICKDFKDYKMTKNKDINEVAIKTDVENYLYLSGMNKGLPDNSFQSIHNYFITADHCFVDWAKSRKKGSIPFILLPSVWYSIILKFSGRSNDDYSAFTKFLNLSFIDSDITNNIPNDFKKDILPLVLALDEPTDVKDDVVYYIDKIMQNKENNIASVEELVNNAHEYIIEQRTSVAVNEKEIKHKNEIINLKMELTDKIHLESQQSYIKGRSDALLEAQQKSEKERDLIIQRIAAEKTNKVYTKYKVITTVFVLLLIAFFTITFLVLKETNVDENVKLTYDCLKWGVSILYGIICFFVIRIKFKNFDKEAILKDITEKE